MGIENDNDGILAIITIILNSLSVLATLFLLLTYLLSSRLKTSEFKLIWMQALSIFLQNVANLIVADTDDIEHTDPNCLI